VRSEKKLSVSEAFLKLSRDDQREVLELAREKTDRPTHLLEKDVWVVWTLGALFDSPLSTDLTFKGGTSLSKAYKIIDRFSEDIDLTYDIRKLIGDLIDDDGALPSSRSQANKWTKAVRERFPDWIATQVQPVIEAALAREQVDAKLEIGGKDNDKLFLALPRAQEGYGLCPTRRGTGVRRSRHRRAASSAAGHLRHGGACSRRLIPHCIAVGHECGPDLLGEGNGRACLLCPGPSTRRALHTPLA
jgi:hypothetical protein